MGTLAVNELGGERGGSREEDGWRGNALNKSTRKSLDKGQK